MTNLLRKKLLQESAHSTRELDRRRTKPENLQQEQPPELRQLTQRRCTSCEQLRRPHDEQQDALTAQKEELRCIVIMSKKTSIDYAWNILRTLFHEKRSHLQLHEILDDHHERVRKRAADLKLSKMHSLVHLLERNKR